MKGGLFGEFSVRAQGTVNFVGRYLNESRDRVLLRDVQEDVRPADVGLHEDRRTGNAPVHMRLGREIGNRTDPMILHHRPDCLPVADITPDEGI